MLIGKSQLRTNYDTVIIGSDLSGLLIASKLQNNGHSTLLVDATPQGEPKNFNGLEVLPKGELSNNALEFLCASLGEEIIFDESEQPPITFEAGFKPFVGFGEQGPSFAEEINYYTCTERVSLFTQLTAIEANLAEKFAGDHLCGFQVRQLNIEDGSVMSIEIDGCKTVQCQNLIYSENPTQLSSLIEKEHLSSKTLRQLGKAKLWTSLVLELTHPDFENSEKAMHVLCGNKDKTEPCWGHFLEGRSRWMTLLEAERTADSEGLAGLLKKIQKQVKRAYPEIFESVKMEKISVHYASHGEIELELTGHQTLPKIENLWIGSRWAGPQKNLLGSFCQAQLVFAAFGFDESSVISAEPQETAEL